MTDTTNWSYLYKIVGDNKECETNLLYTLQRLVLRN
jgi:hypothetical protein